MGSSTTTHSLGEDMVSLEVPHKLPNADRRTSMWTQPFEEQSKRMPGLSATQRVYQSHALTLRRYPLVHRTDYRQAPGRAPLWVKVGSEDVSKLLPGKTFQTDSSPRTTEGKSLETTEEQPCWPASSVEIIVSSMQSEQVPLSPKSSETSEREARLAQTRARLEAWSALERSISSGLYTQETAQSGSQYAPEIRAALKRKSTMQEGAQSCSEPDKRNCRPDKRCFLTIGPSDAVSRIDLISVPGSLTKDALPSASADLEAAAQGHPLVKRAPSHLQEYVPESAASSEESQNDADRQHSQSSVDVAEPSYIEVVPTEIDLLFNRHGIPHSFQKFVHHNWSTTPDGERKPLLYRLIVNHHPKDETLKNESKRLRKEFKDRERGEKREWKKRVKRDRKDASNSDNNHQKRLEHVLAQTCVYLPWGELVLRPSRIVGSKGQPASTSGLSNMRMRRDHLRKERHAYLGFAGPAWTVYPDIQPCPRPEIVLMIQGALERVQRETARMRTNQRTDSVAVASKAEAGVNDSEFTVDPYTLNLRDLLILAQSTVRSRLARQ